jgi:hypothetical protein
MDQTIAFRLLFVGLWGGLTFALVVLALATCRSALANRDPKKSQIIGVLAGFWSMVFLAAAAQGLVFGHISARGGYRIEGPEAHFDGAGFLIFGVILLAVSVSAFKVSSQARRRD